LAGRTLLKIQQNQKILREPKAEGTLVARRSSRAFSVRQTDPGDVDQLRVGLIQLLGKENNKPKESNDGAEQGSVDTNGTHKAADEGDGEDHDYYPSLIGFAAADFQAMRYSLTRISLVPTKPIAS
jgi:hypothetical protein